MASSGFWPGDTSTSVNWYCRLLKILTGDGGSQVNCGKAENTVSPSPGVFNIGGLNGSTSNVVHSSASGVASLVAAHS